MSERRSADRPFSNKRGWTPPDLVNTAKVAADVVPIDREKELEEARRQGYEAGFAQGLADGRAESERVAGQMNALLAAMASPFEDSDAALLRDLLALTRRVTAAVVRRELSLSLSTLESVLSECLTVLADSTDAVEITLNPADAALCREHGLVDNDRVVIRESAQVHPGGLTLRCGASVIDARVEARLQTVLDSLYADAGLPAPDAPALVSLDESDGDTRNA